MRTLHQHGRMNSPFYTQPPPAPKPKPAPFTPYRGAFGLFRIQLPDGTEKGPFASRKLARRSIPQYRRLWEAQVATEELQPPRREEVASC